MKTKLIRLTMLSLIVSGLLAFVSIMVDFTLKPIRNYGINAAYAMGPRPRKPSRFRPPIFPQNPIPVPEPSTLILLGSGLAVGGGIYTIIRYRKRNKKD